jgi:hypothetical protein
MKKALIVAATAVVLVGGSALAYKAYARYDGWGHGRYHSRMSADDASAFADARIAALKAGLKLNADQEKLWPPVESALKQLAAKRIERREEFRAQREERRAERRADRDEQRPLPNPIERLRKGADRLSETGADLKKLADATEPLYNTLDDAQKRRFNALAHAGMRNMRGMDRHREERGWRRHGEFNGPRHLDRMPHHDEFGPGMRHRTEWTPAAPQGAERL